MSCRICGRNSCTEYHHSLHDRARLEHAVSQHGERVTKGDVNEIEWCEFCQAYAIGKHTAGGWLCLDCRQQREESVS